MRILAVAALTLSGALIAQVYPGAYLVAVGICFITFVALSNTSRKYPTIASLRHATLGAGADFIVAVIVGFLLAFATDLSLEVRIQLRIVILAVVTAPALYWLLLLITGGFKD